MTPDQPYTIAVCLLGSVLVWVLPRRYALVPLAVSICCWPSTLLVPPPNIGLTAQRIIALMLMIRCLTTREIRGRFKWGPVDTAAVFYFVMLTVSQMITQGPGKAINNRGGFFLSAMVPFWCVRLLITDRESLYALIKGWIWAGIPLVIGGFYSFFTGNHPVFDFMRYGVPPIDPARSQRPVDMRMMFGAMHYRAQCPFLQAIMFGWFFALMIAWSTNLFWEKRKLFPWIIPWLVLPWGIIVSISGGPMMLAALSFFLLCLFPFRDKWKSAVWTLVVLCVVFGVVSRRNPLEIMANLGFDQSSSWYRVGLQRQTLEYGGMSGHWIAGYGEVPGSYYYFHDLCIHWICVVVFNGLMGVVGFYTLVFASVWQLWNAKKKAHTIEDQWLLWSLLATWVASMMSMFVVSLFAEMYFIYHMFLGVMANTPILMGGKDATRQVGVMATLDGKPVLLRYTLRQGQKLAIVRPPTGPAPESPPPQ